MSIALINGLIILITVLANKENTFWTSVFVSVDWQVVFLARPGISPSFVMDWRSGSASTTDDPSCLEDACNKHYRSGLLDRWPSNRVIKVSVIISHIAFILRMLDI